MSTIVETHDDHGHHGPAKGLTRWLFTTNHKDIGTLYLWFSFLMLFICGAMAMVIRAELFDTVLQIVQQAETFDFSITFESCGTTKILTGPFEIT